MTHDPAAAAATLAPTPPPAPPAPHPRSWHHAITLPDVLAVLVLGGFCTLLWFYPRTAVIEDFWYHLALGHWIAEHGRLFLTDPVSFQPFGRPQLYPLLVHSLVAVGEWIGGSAIVGSILVRTALFVGNLAAAWWAGRRLISPLAGYVAMVLLATDQALFYSAWSLMPAALVGLCIVLLTVAIERRRWVVVALLLAAAGYTHLVLPWLVLGGVLLTAWARPELRRPLLRAAGAAFVLLLPFLVFILSHLGDFYAEKSLSANPIPGYGPFGYASHYHLDVLLFYAGVMGAFHVVLPQRRWVATLLGLLAALTPVLIGIEDLPKLAGSVLARVGITGLSAPPWFRPEQPLLVGSALALLCLSSFLVLGLRRISPRAPSRAQDAALAAAGTVTLLAGAVLTFHQELQHVAEEVLPTPGLWDGLALGADLLLVTALVAGLLRLLVPRALPAAIVLAASFFSLGVVLPLAPVLIITLVPPVLMVAAVELALAGAIGWLGYALLRWVARRDRTHRPPLGAGISAALCFLLVLLPVLPTYGGRYFWHVGGLLALLAVSSLTREHPLSRMPIPLRALLCAYVMMAVALNWPLFAYSRGWRRELASQPPPLLMATTAPQTAEYEEEDFLRLVAWVQQHAPPGAVIHTDDGRTAHMLSIFTDHPSDIGMFWEAQTKSLNDRMEAARQRGIGVYVFTGDLPRTVPTQEVIGKWKVAYQPELPPATIEDSDGRQAEE